MEQDPPHSCQGPPPLASRPWGTSRKMKSTFAQVQHKGGYEHPLAINLEIKAGHKEDKQAGSQTSSTNESPS